LFKLRSQNLLHIERDNSGFKKVFDHGIKKQTTPFSSNRNPFSNAGPNPFLRSR
jgi:hypothetical protein